MFPCSQLFREDCPSQQQSPPPASAGVALEILPMIGDDGRTDVRRPDEEPLKAAKRKRKQGEAKELIVAEVGKMRRGRNSSGRHTPPILCPGSIVQILPRSAVHLIVAIEERADHEIVVYTADMSSPRFLAFYPDQLCAVTERYFKRFYTSGIGHLPPSDIKPDAWIWTYCCNTKLLPVRYSPASTRRLTNALCSRTTFGVYLPHEGHAVSLISIFGFFAVPHTAPHEPFRRFKVQLTYPGAEDECKDALS